MVILGINAYHADSAACLLRDGVIVAAAEEERFRRVKHWAGLPVESIKFCLQEAGIFWADVDEVALNRQPGIHNLRRIAFGLRHWPHPKLVWEKIRNMGRVASIDSAVRLAFPGEKIASRFHHIEHHHAHLASAFAVSNFDEAVCLSVDGFGDFASVAWGMGRKGSIQIDGRVYFPHSLGIFYSAVTQFLGFPHYGDEYKVMGLAPYGERRYLKEMRELVRIKVDGTFELNLRYFRHHTGQVSYSWENCSPEVGCLFRKAEMERLLGPQRSPADPLEQKHKDMAASAQAVYEEAFFALLQMLSQKYQCLNLALSGGCAMNSVANGKVYLNSPFRKMYIPAAAGDAGGAIGAACAVWHAQIGKTVQMDHAYLGPGYSSAQIAALLQERGILSPASSIMDLNVSCLPDTAELCLCTARAIADGKVVGWFQGRMEWGPRALGNRSILADVRRADMKEILNQKIKRRESFRPFAPSILRERVGEWFEQEDDVPFMMEVFQVRAGKRSQAPATTHVDGSGRLQTVHRETNPLYHQLISEYFRITGVPMILNTSFNENEPVVCRPEQALDCFLRTKMDVLVLGNYFLSRN